MDSEIENLVEDMLFNTASSDSTESSELSSSEENSRTTIQNFVETIVPLYSDIEFKKHFRISRNICYQLIKKLSDSNYLPKHTFGREKISCEKAFLLTLWYLANQDSFREVADRFDLTLSSSHRVLVKVLIFLISMRKEYIVWPNELRKREISREFQSKHKMKNIIGAIDGSHIRIKKPRKDEEVYVNRKGIHSVLLQGIVDCDRRFIDVYCGEPGSLHDARLLKKSDIYRKVSNEPNFFGNYFLLGDSAYPSLPWLVAPFKDNGSLTKDQKTFNFKHSSCRIVVEHAFGLLKQRFRRLRNFENLNINIIVKCIMAACVLHNICIDENDTSPDFEYNEENSTDNSTDSDDVDDSNLNKRDKVFLAMFNNT